MPVAIRRFDLSPGDRLGPNYIVQDKIGAGWEGEVYKIRETGTGIERAAKLFYPHRNLRRRASLFHARKLHKLRNCPSVIQYHAEELIDYSGTTVTALISEFVEGEVLQSFLQRQPGKRLTAFQALHLLHALMTGIECIHRSGEYHGDLHIENVIVRRFGLGFDLKVLDMFSWGKPNRDNFQHDIVSAVRVFYDSIGGQKHYAKQPQPVKDIVRGLRPTLILKRFKSATQLRVYLENLSW
jgi:serine/threonine protein kinase